MSFMTERYFQLLETHKIYDRLLDEESLRFFVEHHIVCVWGYNFLLRNIHSEVARSIQIVSQPLQKEATRLVNELILDEEVEEQSDGSLVSHLEIYLDAMVGLGADIGPITSFLDMLEAGTSLKEALLQANFPRAAQNYLEKFIPCFTLPVHERAAILFYEGEPFIPDNFLNKLGQARQSFQISGFLEYFEKHIEGLKRPGFSAIGRLVELLCGDDEGKNQAAESRAEETMKARIELWNHILDEIGEHKDPIRNKRDRSNLRLITDAV